MNINMKSPGCVTINGTTYTGSNLTIKNGEVIIDGVSMGSPGVSITVEVFGPVEKVESASGDVVVHGDVGSVQTKSGDVACRGKVGSVRTMSGDIRGLR